MNPKSITTSHSVVACDVCGRRLLRGEHSETFIASGSRRIVCELCTARAAHEGWLREGLDDVGARRNGTGRSRSLWGKLRSRREAYVARAAEEEEEEDEPMAHERYERSRAQRLASPEPRQPREVHAVPTNAELKLARAVEVYNASEHPRMVAGVTRSLGTPFGAVVASLTEGAVVSVVVGWELTWYRFEVDLGNEAAGVRVADQGNELEELADEHRLANATVAPDGSVALSS